MIDALYDRVNLLLIALVLAHRRKVMEIDKEYLDQQFEANFQRTMGYLDKTLDEKLDKFEEKLDEKLAAQTKDLKSYVHESFETQQVYLDERFKELTAGMEVKVNFPALKTR